MRGDAVPIGLGQIPCTGAAMRFNAARSSSEPPHPATTASIASSRSGRPVLRRMLPTLDALIRFPDISAMCRMERFPDQTRKARRHSRRSPGFAQRAGPVSGRSVRCH